MNCFSLGPFGSLLAGRGRARLKCRFLGSVCFLMWPRTLHLNQLSSNSDIYPGLTLCFRIRGELSRDHLVKKRNKNMPQERLSRLLFHVKGETKAVLRSLISLSWKAAFFRSMGNHQPRQGETRGEDEASHSQAHGRIRNQFMLKYKRLILLLSQRY